jgi:hypothetical protein
VFSPRFLANSDEGRSNLKGVADLKMGADTRISTPQISLTIRYKDVEMNPLVKATTNGGICQTRREHAKNTPRTRLKFIIAKREMIHIKNCNDFLYRSLITKRYKKKLDIQAHIDENTLTGPVVECRRS